MQNAASKRLFFALWPDPATRDGCSKLIPDLRGSGGKPVAAHNLHVTLVFLGAVDSRQQQAISQAASTLHVAAMALHFDQLSYWRKPAIGCLTTSRVDPAVVTLAAQLTAIAEDCGIAVDKRPYQPHVTLFRNQHAPLQYDFQAIAWQAHDFCLVESCSTACGVLYQVLNRWPSHN